MKKKPKQRLTIPINPPDIQEEQEDMARPPFRYDEVLSTAMLPDLEAMEELLAFFMEQEQITHKRAARGHSPRLKHLTTIYQYLRDQVQRAITYVEACQLHNRTPHIEFWHHYANNRVLLCPHFGQFSLYDIARLTGGIPGGRPGLKGLPIPGYGTINVTPTGWHLTMCEQHEFSENEEGSIIQRTIPIDEETLHRILVNALHVEDVPFSHKCVLPFPTSSPGPWKAPLDGMSVVIPPQTFQARDGELVEWDAKTITIEPNAFHMTVNDQVHALTKITEISNGAPKRLSMARLHYEALVYSVAFERYNDAKGSMDVHEGAHQHTLSCFGTSRLPRNSREVTQWLSTTEQSDEEMYEEGETVGRLDEKQEEEIGELEDQPF